MKHQPKTNNINGRTVDNKFGLDINDYDSYDDYRRAYNRLLEWHRRNKGKNYEDKGRVYTNKVNLNRDDFDSNEEYRKEYKKLWAKTDEGKKSLQTAKKNYRGTNKGQKTKKVYSKNYKSNKVCKK